MLRFRTSKRSEVSALSIEIDRIGRPVSSERVEFETRYFSLRPLDLLGSWWDHLKAVCLAVGALTALHSGVIFYAAMT